MTSSFSLVDQLATLPYFLALERSQVEGLAQQAIRRTFATGETIFLQGDVSDGLWLIEQGRIKVYKVNPDGIEHIMHLLGPGNTFNDIAAFDGGANPANAAALAQSILWLLPAHVLRLQLETNPALALVVIQQLSKRVRTLVEQIENLALHSVTIRLARFLLKQTDDPALSGPGITRAAIAAHLATTPETVSRALRSLEDTGAIRFDRHRIIIERRDILEALALL